MGRRPHRHRSALRRPPRPRLGPARRPARAQGHRGESARRLRGHPRPLRGGDERRTAPRPADRRRPVRRHRPPRAGHGHGAGPAGGDGPRGGPHPGGADPLRRDRPLRGRTARRHDRHPAHVPRHRRAVRPRARPRPSLLRGARSRGEKGRRASHGLPRRGRPARGRRSADRALLRELHRPVLHADPPAAPRRPRHPFLPPRFGHRRPDLRLLPGRGHVRVVPGPAEPDAPAPGPPAAHPRGGRGGGGPDGPRSELRAAPRPRRAARPRLRRLADPVLHDRRAHGAGGRAHDGLRLLLRRRALRGGPLAHRRRPRRPRLLRGIYWVDAAIYVALAVALARGSALRPPSPKTPA